MDESKDYKDKILAEQVRLAIQQLLTMQIGSFLGALVLSFAVRNIISRANIIVWLLMISVPLFSRILLYYRFQKVDEKFLVAKNWENVYLLLSLFSGIIWGLSAFMIFPVGNMWQMALFIIIIAGMSAGTTASHAGIKLGSTAWVVPVLLLYAYRCVMAGGEFEYILALFFVVFMFVMIIHSLKNNEAITSAISLKFENIGLLKAVQDSEERFRTLAGASFEGVVISQNGIIKDCNEQLSRMLGFKKEELIDKPIRDLLPSEEIERVMANINTGRDVIIDHDLLCKDGSRRSIEAHGKASIYHGNEYRITAIHDITERKKADQALRRNEEMLRNILNSVDEGFIVVDKYYRILTANRAYCDQIGLPLDEVLEKFCYKVSHKVGRPCYQEGEECAVLKVFETGEPAVVYHNYRDADGNILHMETKAFPLKDAAGNITSVIESINNITGKHLLEQERLKTQKLEAIGTLAGGIAHDFNNLLQGVIGYISLAKLANYGRQKSLAVLDQAEKALHMSVKLTNQLLTFSKGGKPVKKIIELWPMIDNAAHFALSGSRSEYQIVADEGLWQVEADDGQITQVIQNIVLNADQSMPEGGHVEITARNIHVADSSLFQGLQKGKYVQIAIKDSGIGIQEKYIAKIFDPYFTTKEKGSGLGLATSYSIVKNHNGLIDVQSEVGKGTTFFIYLPASSAREEAEPLKPMPGNSPVRTAKVLIMDDEPVIRDVAGELIKALGHEVEFAAHGEEAVEKYLMAKQSEKPFDMVILDLTIRGGMGGAETIGKLLAIDPGVKAVVSSGYSDDDIISNLQKQGVKEFLKKPYNVDRLREVLNKCLTHD